MVIYVSVVVLAKIWGRLSELDSSLSETAEKRISSCQENMPPASVTYNTALHLRLNHF
jgi:hypothetical protein